MTDTLSPAWPRAILFDLDGTLIDSVPDLAAAVNALLAENGHAPLTIDAVRAMIGHGVAKLVQRAFAACDVALEEPALTPFFDRMMTIYMADLTSGTSLMPGAAETLAAYHAQGVRTGVITNKPQVATEGIVAHFGLGNVLDVVVGGDAVPNKKPSPDIVLAALASLGIPPADALVVGDSAADVDAARAAGVPVIVVEGGYTADPVDRLGADRVILSLTALPAAIARINKLA